MRNERSGAALSRFRLRQRRISIEPLESRRMLARLFDVDRDGDLDVLHNVAWYENYDGFGNFIAHVIRKETADVSLATDLDGDGDQDILTSDLKWYENDGNRNFLAEHDITSERESFDEIEVFDVGGDGDFDVIGSAGNQVHLFDNNGTGSFVESIHDLPPETNDIGDFDLDGRLDYLMSEGREVWIRRDLGDGAFERQHLWTIGFRDIPQFRGELADVNGDGQLDLVIRIFSGGNDSSVLWLENKDGTIAETDIHVGEEGHGHLYFRDIDHDGDLDSLYNDGMAQELSWRLNIDGEFEHGGSVPAYPPGSFSYPPDIGDINGDGLIDALAIVRDGLPTWIDSATNEIHATARTDSATAFVEHELHIESGSVVLTGDFDGDGKQDFVVRGYMGATDLVWLADHDNDRIYEFAKPIPDSRLLGSNPTFVVDFDLDGDSDLVTFDTSDNGSPLVAFENTDGRGTLEQRPLGIDVTGSLEQLLVDDLDRDGDPDLITVSRDGRRMELSAHFKEGSFETQVLGTWTNRGPWSLELADADGDGDIDVYTSRGTFVRWFENERDHFASRKQIVHVAAGSLEISDIDADGDLDLIVANDESIHFVENQDGDFMPTFEMAHPLVGAIGVKDIDADGDLDLFGHSSRSVRWFENRSGELAGPLIIDQTRDSFADTDLVDWDGDGDLDIVKSEVTGWTLLENRRVGDVNDDGVFDSADLVKAFQAGQYDDTLARNATFDEGDWNQDGAFDSGDLVVAFQAGHYIAAARPLESQIAAAVDWIFADDDAKKGRAFVA